MNQTVKNQIRRNARKIKREKIVTILPILKKKEREKRSKNAAIRKKRRNARRKIRKKIVAILPILKKNVREKRKL